MYTGRRLSICTCIISRRLNVARKLIVHTTARRLSVVVEGFLELFAVAQKQMVVKRFDHVDLLQLPMT